MEFIAPNKDVFEIAPATPERVKAALQKLKDKKGIVITGTDTTLLNGLEFQAAMCREVLLSWKRHDPDTDTVATAPATVLEREVLLNTRPKVVSWIVRQANKLAADADPEFDEEAGNS